MSDRVSVVEKFLSWVRLPVDAGILVHSLLQSGVLTAVFSAVQVYLPDGPIYKYVSVGLFFLVCLLSTYIYLARRKRVPPEYLAHIVEINDHFTNVAAQDAYCDQILFDQLYVQIRSATSKLSLYKIVQTARTAAVDNIVDLIGFTLEIYRQYTKARCAICIKFIKENDKGELGVKAIFRDTLNKHRTDSNEYPVGDNTAYTHILAGFKNRTIAEPVTYFMRNDLVLEESKGLYRNARPDWKKDYTATLVYPITVVAKNENKEKVNKIIAFFCVDNKQGGFDDGLCIHYAKILSARIGVMLYRLDELGYFNGDDGQ